MLCVVLAVVVVAGFVVAVVSREKVSTLRQTRVL